MALELNFVSDLALKIIAATVVILIGTVLGSILAKITKTLIRASEIEKVLETQGYKLPLEEGISAIVRYVTIIAAVIWAIFQFGFATVVLQVILIVGLILLIVFIILAVKDFIPNMAAGFYLYQKGFIGVGDDIKTQTAEGRVIDISLVETKLKTKKGDILVIPNAMLTKHEIVQKRKARIKK